MERKNSVKSLLMLRSRLFEDPGFTFGAVYLVNPTTKLLNYFVCYGENPIRRSFPQASIVEILEVEV